MNTQELRGDQRVAAFLLSLDKDKAAELMSRLDPEAVPSVAKAMLELDPTFSQPESVDQLYGEVARDLYTRRGVDCAPVDTLNELLTKSLGDQVGAEVSKEIEDRRLAERPFAKVELASASNIATALSEDVVLGLELTKRPAHLLNLARHLTLHNSHCLIKIKSLLVHYVL